jgi:hypothetical protein
MINPAEAYVPYIRNDPFHHFGMPSSLMHRHQPMDLLGKRSFQDDLSLYQATVKKLQTEASSSLLQGPNPVGNTLNKLPVLNYSNQNLSFLSSNQNYASQFDLFSLYAKNMKFSGLGSNYGQQASAGLNTNISTDFENLKAFNQVSQPQPELNDLSCGVSHDSLIALNAKNVNINYFDDLALNMSVKTETRSNSEESDQMKEASATSTGKSEETLKRKAGRPKKNSTNSNSNSAAKSAKSLKKIIDEDLENDSEALLSYKDEGHGSESEVCEPTLVEYTRQFPEWDLETIFRFLKSSKSKDQFQKAKEARIMRACIGAQKKTKKQISMF